MFDSTVSLVGWTLVHSLWQGALIGAAAAALLAAIPRRWSRARYAVLCAGLLLHLGAPLTTALVLSPGAPLAPGTVTTLLTAQSHETARSLTGTGAATDRPGAVDIGGTARSPGTAPGGSPADDRSSAPAAVGMVLAGLDRALPAIVTLWLLGVAVGGARLIGGWLSLRRLISRAEPAAGALTARARALASRLGIGRAVRLLVSRDVDGPFTTGWWRPVVVMPLSMLSTLDPVHVDALLTHELAHIRRWDYAVSVLQGVMLVLLFHHPVTWWLDRRLRVEREYCCDDLAVATSRDRAGYLRALAELESLRLGLPSLALAANDGSLRDRVERLLGMRPSAPAPGWAAALALAAVLLAAALPDVGRLDAGTRDLGTATTTAWFRERSTPAMTNVAPVNREIRRPTVQDDTRSTGEAPVERQQGNTVVRHPDSSAPLAERWRWALNEARRRGGDVVIGWRVRSAVSDGDLIISSTDGTSDAPGRSVAEIVGGEQRDRNGVAVLLTWSAADRGALGGVRLRGFDTPLALRGAPLLWLGPVADGESITHIERMMVATADPTLRAELAAALALHDDVRAVTRVARQVMESESDPRVRAEMVAWLGNHLGDADALALVRRALDDSSADVRDEAVSLLAESGGRSTVPALLELLRTSPHADVRSEVAQRLAGGNDDVVAALLRAAFDDPSHDVRREAVDALIESRGGAARRALREIADRHPERRLRSEAREALDEGR